MRPGDFDAADRCRRARGAAGAAQVAISCRADLLGPPQPVRAAEDLGAVDQRVAVAAAAVAEGVVGLAHLACRRGGSRAVVATAASASLRQASSPVSSQARRRDRAIPGAPWHQAVMKAGRRHAGTPDSLAGRAGRASCRAAASNQCRS